MTRPGITRNPTLGLPDKGFRRGISRNKCVILDKSAHIYPSNRAKVTKSVRSEQNRHFYAKSPLLLLLSETAERLFPELVFWPGSDTRFTVGHEESHPRRRSEVGAKWNSWPFAGGVDAKVTKWSRTVFSRPSALPQPGTPGIQLSPRNSTLSLIKGGVDRLLSTHSRFLSFTPSSCPLSTLEEASQLWATWTRYTNPGNKE